MTLSQLIVLFPLLTGAVRGCPGPCTCHLEPPAPTVNCSMRHLTSVPEDIPRDVHALLLPSNELSDLYGQVPPLKDLLFLDLSRNRIKQLGRGLLFKDLTSLQVLDLSHNDFRTLFNGVFRGVARTLRTLVATHVQIRFIEERVFEGLTQLRTLHLSHNRLGQIFPEWFRDLQHLEELHLENNHVAYINADSFVGLTSLRRLSLNGNRVRGVSPKGFRGLDNLSHLYLEDNQISKVPSEALEQLKNLKVLKVGGNSFPQLHTGDFQHLPRLEELSVEEVADLEMVDRAAFLDLPHLKTLHLHGCSKLRWVDASAFVGLNHLRVLSLHGGNLTSLSARILDFFDGPLQISLHDNPLTCDCNLRWMRNLAISNSSIRLLKSETLLCNRNISIANMGTLPDDCPPALVLGSLNRTIERRVGEGYVFHCRAHGVPMPAIHWILPDGSVLNQTTSIDEYLDSLQTEATKRSAANNDTQDERSKQNIDDKEKPHSTRLQDESTTSQTSSYSHYYDLEPNRLNRGLHPIRPLSSSNYYIHPTSAMTRKSPDTVRVVLDRPGSLEVYSIRPSDAGVYTCIAENLLGRAEGTTQLVVENVDIHLFPLGVGSTFVTVVWNGTARNAFPEYEILYHELGTDGGNQSVTVSQFFRSYTVNHLHPEVFYRLCIGVRSAGQYVPFSCTKVQTRDELFALQGVKRTSNVAVAIVLGILAAMGMVVCAVTVAARKYRHRHYDTPQKSLVGHMTLMPMESLNSPLVTSARPH